MPRGAIFAALQIGNSISLSTEAHIWLHVRSVEPLRFERRLKDYYAGSTVTNQMSQIYSDHRRLENRSLAMHQLIASKILADPALINQARGVLSRWRAQAAEPLPSYFLEWEQILENRPESIADFLVSPSEDATRLRQSSPFTNVLTNAERSEVYATFR
jgi:hypothetical protein